MVLEADGSIPSIVVIESLRSELQPRIDRLESDVRLLTRERDDLAAQVAAASGSTEATSPNDIPALGVVVLAVLGGALAGFAMAWLGQRREPTPIAAEAAPSGRPVTT
jgi:hypothetical protein